MDETTTRRGFLKGLAATVALITVAPQLIMEEAEAAAPAALDTLYPLTETGELWVKLGRWRLLGGIRTLSTYEQVCEAERIDSEFVAFRPMRSAELLADIVTNDAAPLARELLWHGEPVDLRVGLRDYEIEVPRARITDLQIGIDEPTAGGFLSLNLRARHGETVYRCR